MECYRVSLPQDAPWASGARPRQRVWRKSLDKAMEYAAFLYHGQRINEAGEPVSVVWCGAWDQHIVGAFGSRGWLLSFDGRNPYSVRSTTGGAR